MVQSLRSDNVTYLYSAPHGFFYDKGQGDVARMLNYAGADLSHVLLADTHNHTLPCRYIMNPPGVNATIHQHIGLGEGEVDFDALFQALREMDFANRTFKVGVRQLSPRRCLVILKNECSGGGNARADRAGATRTLKTGGFACTAPQAGAVICGNYPSFSASSRRYWKI